MFYPLRIQESSSPTEHQYEDQKWMLRQYGSIISCLLSWGKHMTAYKTYVGVQRYLSTNDLDIKTLSRAFSNLPQLETFCLDVWNCHTGSRELSGAFGYFRCDQIRLAGRHPSVVTVEDQGQGFRARKELPRRNWWP